MASRGSVPPNLGVGQSIAGKYELVRRLGTGSMGEVWAAKHLSLEEEVAIKLVVRDVEHEDGTTAESRFLLEARLAASLSRKTRHIVAVTDHGQDGPYAYLVMDLLVGESLDVRLHRTGPMPLAKVVPIVYQIARALTVAHASGIVHRDLKPSNVFLTLDEDKKVIVKILDFGIAKIRSSVSRLRVSMNDARHKTMRGFLLGTPAYMSPEQASARANLDHRVDVWALAVIAYHLLTSEYPFDGSTADELFSRLLHFEPRPVRERRPDLPPSLDDFFRRAFAENIEDRFQSAVALAGAFEQIEVLSRGGEPHAMPRISLPPGGEGGLDNTLFVIPPPPALPLSPGTEITPFGRRALEERERERMQASAIEAAGVPRRRAPFAKLAAAALLVCFLLVAAALVALDAEREPRAGSAPAVPTARVEGALMKARDIIPPPSPSPAELAPTPLPEQPSSAVAHNATGRDAVPAPRAVEAPPIVPVDVPAPTQPTAEIPAPVKKDYDKSEVF